MQFYFCFIFSIFNNLSYLMNYNSENFTNKQLLQLYKALVKPRMIEEKMLILLQQRAAKKMKTEKSRQFIVHMIR